jgi:hypothetical protein
VVAICRSISVWRIESHAFASVLVSNVIGPPSMRRAVRMIPSGPV